MLSDKLSPEVTALTNRYDDGKQLDDTPMMNPFFGQPEDTFELINKYGTYNIQPTNEQENRFPAIAQAMPTQWKDMEVRKEELEELQQH